MTRSESRSTHTLPLSEGRNSTPELDALALEHADPRCQTCRQTPGVLYPGVLCECIAGAPRSPRDTSIPVKAKP